MWLLTVATGVRVGVEQSGSSSHGDTVGEISAFVVTLIGDSTWSIRHNRSKKSILILLKLKKQSEGREARQCLYIFRDLKGKSNTLN